MRVRCSLRVLVYACLVASTWAAVGDASAATKKAKEPAPVVVSTKPTKQQFRARAKPVNPTCQEKPRTRCHGASTGGYSEAGQASTD